MRKATFINLTSKVFVCELKPPPKHTNIKASIISRWAVEGDNQVYLFLAFHVHVQNQIAIYFPPTESRHPTSFPSFTSCSGHT